MNSRIKMIREAKELTQDSFGKIIGSARNTIANYENGNRTPSNAVINSICREFNVNETWLRTGEGEMYVPRTRDDDIAELTLTLLTEESDSFKNRLISALSRLSEEQWEMLAEIAEMITKKEQD
jgi:transcriptional regulator with XRE-family HTH domain